MLIIYIFDMSLQITNSKLQPNLPGLKNFFYLICVFACKLCDEFCYSEAKKYLISGEALRLSGCLVTLTTRPVSVMWYYITLNFKSRGFICEIQYLAHYAAYRQRATDVNEALKIQITIPYCNIPNIVLCISGDNGCLMLMLIKLNLQCRTVLWYLIKIRIKRALCVFH